MVISADAKTAIRVDALERRNACRIDDRLTWDRAITGHLLASGLLNSVNCAVAGYWPMRSEADPRPVLVDISRRGVPTALPAMTPRDDRQGHEITFRAWAPDDPLVPGGFGTQVPVESAAVVQPVCLIVPLLAFDVDCRRLGYGKGHYDRAITALKRSGPLLTIGIAYAVQELQLVPTEPHDQVLDAIVTQKGILRAKAHI